jgi:hypothetical protein
MFLTNMIPVHHFHIYLLIWLLVFPSWFYVMIFRRLLTS